ncbi:hypothetical protein [Streptomyces sp. ME18-1-4]|nr:hypothetical protein [Streptomyces sp. ME18-1-4]MDX3241725.1 hypothetical protein [Streptomyces sp. ME18-1-4]
MFERSRASRQPGFFLAAIAFEHPLFGVALLVGVGMVTLLHVLMGR